MLSLKHVWGGARFFFFLFPLFVPILFMGNWGIKQKSDLSSLSSFGVNATLLGMSSLLYPAVLHVPAGATRWEIWDPPSTTPVWGMPGPWLLNKEPSSP